MSWTTEDLYLAGWFCALVAAIGGAVLGFTWLVVVSIVVFFAFMYRWLATYEQWMAAIRAEHEQRASRDPAERLRKAYVDGSIDEAEFERRLDAVLEDGDTSSTADEDTSPIADDDTDSRTDGSSVGRSDPERAKERRE